MKIKHNTNLNEMNIETRFEKAIIQGDLDTVRDLVYTKGIRVTRRHVKIARVLRDLCEKETDTLYTPIIQFLEFEYLPYPKFNWLQKLFSINIDFSN